MDKSIKAIIQSVADQGGEKNDKIEETVQLIVFELDKEEYGVPIDELTEIIKITEITPVPDAPDFIRGILNLRGKIVVVVDLEKRFGLKREHSLVGGQKHIIITEIENSNYGVIVDEVTEVLRVPVSNIRSAPSLVSSKIEADYLSGVAVLGEAGESEINPNNKNLKPQTEPQTDSRLIILLDLQKMLQEKELLKLGRTAKEVTGGER